MASIDSILGPPGKQLINRKDLQDYLKGGPTVFKLEEFGAVPDDDDIKDGVAIKKWMDAINAAPGDHLILATAAPGRYVITGGSNLHASGGVTQGIPDCTRANVYFALHGAEFFVPDDFRWQRTQIGGGDEDHFAFGLRIKGDDCTVAGGFFNGNLRNRSIVRGSTAANYGGFEVGLWIDANGFRAHGVRVEEWGTDCLEVYKSAKFYDSIFKGGRRLGVAIVSNEDAVVEFYDCEISENGTYADKDYNRPASGVDIESDTAGISVSARFYNTTMRDNRKYNVQISAGGSECIFDGGDFFGETKTWSIGTAELTWQAFNLQPAHEGGHIFRRLHFHGSQYFETVYNEAGVSGSSVLGCIFERADVSGGRLVNFRTHADTPEPWIVSGNQAPNVVDKTQFTPQKAATGSGHIVLGNVAQDFDGTQPIVVNGSTGASTPVTVDVATEVPTTDDKTYLVVAKINNGNGSYSVSASWYMSFVSGFEAAHELHNTGAVSGREITLSGSEITFDPGAATSSYGLIATPLGSGTFGT